MNLKLVDGIFLSPVTAVGVFEAASNAPVNYTQLFTMHMTRKNAQSHSRDHKTKREAMFRLCKFVVMTALTILLSLSQVN